MSSSSTNRGYLLQTAGENSGTWGLDPGLNGNFNKVDTNLGGVTTISLSSSNVTLSSTQYANGTIVLSGTLTAHVQVFFPAVQGWWTIINNTTGSFVVGLLIVGSIGQQICVEQGAIADILMDGTNAKFRNLPPVGTYLDVIDSSVPQWISFCTVPPYLLCDGSTFSAVTYPYLNTKLGGTTLPDFRGRSRFYLDGGTGRITTAGSGIDGSTRLSAGGAQNVTISQANFPDVALPVTDPGHLHNVKRDNLYATGSASAMNGVGAAAGANTDSAVTGISVRTGGSGTAVNKMPPACIGGITLIRAA